MHNEIVFQSSIRVEYTLVRSHYEAMMWWNKLLAWVIRDASAPQRRCIIEL